MSKLFVLKMVKTSALHKLWQLLIEEKKEITSIYFYAILSGLLQLSVPIGVQSIIGFVMGANMVTSIYVLICVIVLAVGIVGILQINQMKIIEKIQQKIFTKYAFAFSEVIPRLDLKKANAYYLPEKINRFFDTQILQKSVSKILLDIPTASIQIILGLLLLSLYHPLFIVFSFSLVFILWLILKVTAKKGLVTSIQESDYKYAVAAWLEEMARVIQTFKFSQGSHLNLQKTDQNVYRYLSSKTAHFKVLLFQYKTIVIFKVAITTAMLSVGTYLLLGQQINIGEFIAAEIVILTIIGAIEKLISGLDNVYDVVTSLEKLASITESALEKDGPLELNTENGVQIEFTNFSFEFEQSMPILSDISLTIPPKSKVAIIGNEGAGKTTFLKILSSNYTDFNGGLYFNNLPISNYQSESLRKNTGIFLQEQALFNGTLFENIAMGRKEVTHEKVISIAEKSGLKNFLNNLQMGFESVIDPLGAKLPRSTTKKILLMRALVNQPSILLLDDPILGLEPEIAETFTNYLLSQLPETTLLMTLHDEQLLALFDYEITFINGNAQLKKLK